MNTPSLAFSKPAFRSRVVPVIVITDVVQAVPLAHALLAGGIDVMEITLRHEAGLPAMHVGAGTVTRPQEMVQARDAGARFALSPGLSDALAQAAIDCELPFIPGAMTPSEVMHARDIGFGLVKLFPAAQAGGVAMLKALGGPLPDMKFCPTGGVSLTNLRDYLQQPNVAMVGGSWLTPLDALTQGRWQDITALAAQAVAAAA